MKKIAIASFAIGFLCFLTLFMLVKRPVVLYSAPKVKNYSSPKALKDHVKVISEKHYPRNYKNIDNLNEVARYIKNEFRKYTQNVEFQTYTVEGKEYKNVIASFGPSSTSPYIIGAHYDAFADTYGADDNASGVAGLLELARLLKDTKQSINLVAFTLEEPPFFRTENMGSFRYAKKLSEDGLNVKLMISLEMIGYFTDKEESQSFPISWLSYLYPSTGDFIAIVGNMRISSKTQEIKKAYLERTNIKVQSINSPSIVTGIDFSDHLNFWKFNFPAVMVTDTAFLRNKEYHEVDDTADRLNYTKMAEVVDGIYYFLTNYNEDF